MKVVAYSREYQISGMRRWWLLTIALAVAATNLNAAEWYVSPTGTAKNSGARESPWDLASAVTDAERTTPGDTIWLLPGTYTNETHEFKITVAGEPGKPIVFRAVPGARATIDGAIHIEAPDVWVWGLEVLVSIPRPDHPLPAGSHPQELTRPWGGIHSGTGTRSRIINCIVHDNNQGFSYWLRAIDGEIYGCIIYRNGWVGVDRLHGHAVYTQNDEGTKRIVDNVMFDPYSYLLHAYGSSRAYVNGFHVEGNVFFGGPVLIGGGRPSERIRFVHNYTYKASTRLGYAAPYNEDVVCENNYFASDLEVKNYKSFIVRGNRFVNNARGRYILPEDQPPGKQVWDKDVYVTSSGDGVKNWRKETGFDEESTITITPDGRPEKNAVFVRPNQYEPGRAHIIVYNWENLDGVEVDLSPVLKKGDRFEIRNVQTYFDAPVAEGRYTGDPVKVPLLRGRARNELKLSGDPENRTWQVFGDYPQFDCFVVLPVYE